MVKNTVAADLPNPEQVHDKIPEFYKGYNVADFIHPELDSKLQNIVAEEAEREASGFYELPMLPDDEEARNQHEMIKLLKEHKLIAKRESQLKSTRTTAALTRGKKKSTLAKRDAAKSNEAAAERYFSKKLQSKSAALVNQIADPEKRNRANQLVPRDQSMQLMPTAKEQAQAKATKKSNMGTSDRVYKAKQKAYTKEPKFLYTGKVNVKGKRDYR